MEGLFVEESAPYKFGAVIKVVGVGGAGGNALANMLRAQIGEVEYIAVNSDSQALTETPATTHLLIGKNGLGAGGDPEKGRMFALESVDEIRSALKGADLVFITCGMGGGTGTGAAPVIAAEAKASGALTVSVVSMPHTTAGRKRNDIAKAGLEELIQYVDSFIVVPNDGMQDAGHKLLYRDALRMADDVLRQSIQGICELTRKGGHINIDFADVKNAMGEKGKAVMGIGTAAGENRAKQAVENALKSPLLTDTSIKGAFAVLLNISGNENDLTMDEVSEIQALVFEYAGERAWICDGVHFDERQDGTISATVVATGISGNKNMPDNLTRIEDVQKNKPNPDGSGGGNKLRGIGKRDKNLLSIEGISEEELELPTYLRKQAD